MPIKIIQWRNVSVKRKFYWFIQIKQVKRCTKCKRASYGGLSRDGVHGSSGYSAHVDTPLHQNVALDTPYSWPGVADDPVNEKRSSHWQMLIQRIFEIKLPVIHVGDGIGSITDDGHRVIGGRFGTTWVGENTRFVEDPVIGVDGNANRSVSGYCLFDFIFISSCGGIVPICHFSTGARVREGASSSLCKVASSLQRFDETWRMYSI